MNNTYRKSKKEVEEQKKEPTDSELQNSVILDTDQEGNQGDVL
jgi:hypothetical protein